MPFNAPTPVSRIKSLLCVRPAIVPKDPHFAVLWFITEHLPSRDRHEPGETVVRSHYEAFFVREEWEAEIKRRMTSTVASDHDFVALEVKPAKIDVSVSVVVS